MDYSWTSAVLLVVRFVRARSCDEQLSRKRPHAAVRATVEHSGASSGRGACRDRTHHGARQVARGESRGRLPRPRRHRLSAAELRQESASRRYPVLYALHGYSINNEKWSTEIKTPQTIEGAFATGTREMIVVLAERADETQRLDVLQLRDGRQLGGLTSRTISSRTSTRTTARSRSARAAESPATRWAGMAPCASRCGTPTSSRRFTR